MSALITHMICLLPIVIMDPSLSELIRRFFNTITNNRASEEDLKLRLWRLCQEVSSYIQSSNRVSSLSTIVKEMGASGAFEDVVELFQRVPGVTRMSMYKVPSGANERYMQELLNFPEAQQFIIDVTNLIFTPIDQEDWNELSKRLNLQCCIGGQQHTQLCIAHWIKLK